MKKQVPKTRQALEWVGRGLTAAQAARKLEISQEGKKKELYERIQNEFKPFLS